MKTGKFTLGNSPYIFNVFRNGNIWIKGFNDLSSALRYCIRYAESHNNPLDLWQTYLANGSHDVIRSWN